MRQMLEKAGVRTVEERGRRLFPASGRAFEVADALVRMAERAGAEIVYHARVTDMERESDGWNITMHCRCCYRGHSRYGYAPSSCRRRADS